MLVNIHRLIFAFLELIGVVKKKTPQLSAEKVAKNRQYQRELDLLIEVGRIRRRREELVKAMVSIGEIETGKGYEFIVEWVNSLSPEKVEEELRMYEQYL